MRKFLFLLLFPLTVFAQPRVISGPMLAGVELRDARVWAEVSSDVKSVAVRYSVSGQSTTTQIDYKGALGNAFNPLTLIFYHQGIVAMEKTGS